MARLNYEDVKFFIENMEDKNGNKGFRLISTTYSYKEKLEIVCPFNHTFHSQFRHIKNSGSRCPYCSQTKKLTYEEVKNFINNSTDKNNNGNYNLISTSYENINEKLIIKCPCGHTYEGDFHNFKNGKRCPYCFGTFKFTYEEVKYFVEEQGYELLSKKYDSIEDKLLFQCPKGHVFEMRYNDFKNNGQRCPKCKESKGEREVARVLDKMHIDYERQYKFENCKYKRCLPFDFYIPSLNVCIEYDGEYHYEVRQGTEDDLKQRHIWDETKNVYCEQNNIRLIRIPYWEFNNIEQILKDILE